MPAPSKNWTDIADSAIDSDSLIDSVLLTEFRDNFVHIKEWLGYGYTAAQAHTHNGADSAVLAANAQSVYIDRTLTTTASSFTSLEGVYIYIPAGLTTIEYCVRQHTDNNTYAAHSRLVTDTHNGTDLSNTDVTDTWLTNGGAGGTLSVSDKSGWTLVSLQGYNASGGSTTTITKVVYRLK